MSTATLLDLRDADVAAAGGKARGLARLLRAGLRVPAGVVLLAPDAGDPALRSWLRAEGEPTVAVRSSGREEDGVISSFAGQYESVLGVAGESAIASAIAHCLASATGARALHYAAQTGALAVVVQRMVAPRVAGVLFTVDPDRDPGSVEAELVIVEAVAGLGDALVAGTVTPDRYQLGRDGQLRASVIQGGEPLLDAGALHDLITEALRAEASLGGPLDLEWAIDADGVVWWLQARPITARARVGCDEFDTPIADPDAVFVRYNIGEILPGALTPLTWDLIGRNLDAAMAANFIDLGVDLRGRAGDCIASFSGHAFMNLASAYRFAAGVLGSSKEGVDVSLAGRVLAVPTPFHAPSLPRRLQNTARYVRFLGRAEAELLHLEAQLAGPTPPPAGDAAGWWQRLADAGPRLQRAWRVHLRASMRSGSLGETLQSILSGGKRAGPEQHAEMAGLLADAGEVVGADLVRALDRMCAAIAEDLEVAGRFVQDDRDAALAWLRAGPVAAAFAALLAEHGHRGVRELELHAPDWSEDPRPLVAAMQARVRADMAGPAAPRERTPAPAIAGIRGVLARAIAPKARRAIALRERSKSLVTGVVRQIKRELAALATCLVDAARLPEQDLLYFLVLAEIGRLVDAADPALVQRARQRRSLHWQQARLEFPALNVGVPRPHSPAELDHADEVDLQGTPVSRGVVEGPARVVRTVAEAGELRPGEILVVPHTDVGWTPCFSVAAGLVTEIGGTLSHGAVVAREYGLPAVVDLPGATRVFRTGDRLLLDADRGRVRRLRPA
ncbi:MAG: pyruvate, water dikinase [Nannocystis sp.]|uniref:PEP/pyruvate-binding domain-containing protein n=1 Tax=Nannocystis sp. TaxID=1962667 RepID=UPI002427D317|nr:PEP/pyruvate-binding domain-containing protein [Nannocystis sp.]MBK9754032.1 pyruvate, water dikinase [Nannocystis sp.]